MRFFIGMVQALATPGSRSFLSISSTSSSHVMGRVFPKRRLPIGLSGAGHPERSAGTCRHFDSGLSITVVSPMLKGAGSVEVSALPALPKTHSTSGKLFKILSCI